MDQNSQNVSCKLTTVSYGSKQSKCFDQYLKNRLAYINLNAIFEFLGQFTIRCMHHFQKKKKKKEKKKEKKDVGNFEIEHKTC